MDAATLANILIIVAIAFVFMFILLLRNNRKIAQETTDKETGWNKIMAEFKGSDGFVHRELVSVNRDGKTVTFKGGTYRLSEERPGRQSVEPLKGIKPPEKKDKDKQQEIIPTLSFVKYPNKPFMGIGRQVSLRLECWDEGNPEPKKAFYGKFVDADGNACNPTDEGAKFIEGRLEMTAGEITARINEMQAVEGSIEIETMKDREKTIFNVLRNLPNKMVLYIALFLCALLGVISIVTLISLKSAMGY